jgi:DNA-binding LacI/PurR family transcriptional regulator
MNEAEFSVPSLSSAHPGHDWMVDTMLNLLLERIGGTRTGRELVAPYELIVRDSSAWTRTSGGTRTLPSAIRATSALCADG